MGRICIYFLFGKILIGFLKHGIIFLLVCLYFFWKNTRGIRPFIQNSSDKLLTGSHVLFVGAELFVYIYIRQIGLMLFYA
ncbi:hypothetical protein EGY05_07680 [Chryseobacterium arthrosphaerae]|nr:hypothetical protein EGY05_07680 [Chryseobacterium arthrosphaerae]